MNMFNPFSKVRLDTNGRHVSKDYIPRGKSLAEALTADRYTIRKYLNNQIIRKKSVKF